MGLFHMFQSLFHTQLKKTLYKTSVFHMFHMFHAPARTREHVKKCFYTYVYISRVVFWYGTYGTYGTRLNIKGIF